MVRPQLLMQSTSKASSQGKSISETLTRRIELWERGDLPALLSEGRALQAHRKRGVVKEDESVSSLPDICDLESG